MSFKYQAKLVGPSEWLLENGVSVPIRIFMNQKLYDASEEEMWRQATWATTIPTAQQIIITPDAHAGAGVPVGVVVGTKEYVAPCAAGFDISCGMVSLKTKLNKEQIKTKEIRRQWMKAVEERVALGVGKEQMTKQYRVNDKKFKEILVNGILALETKNLDKFEKTHHQVNEYVHYERAYNRGYYQLASLGGGNHFLELQQDENGNIWIMIHTGSRGYGHQIATDFFNEGLEWHNANNDQKLAPKNKEQVNFPVDSNIGKRYLNAMNQAANFALVNRYLISKAVEEATIEVFNDCPEIVFEISHNLVQFENGLWVHRKGATRALPKGHDLLKESCYENTGHPILIPGSMGTASAILYAEDSRKSLYSINHGCGRTMSRGFAKRNLNQVEVDKEMDDMDILYNTRHVPIDECKHAYKDIDEVLETVEDAKLAKVAVKLIPRAVIKGND